MGGVAGLVEGFRARSGEVAFLDRLDDLRGRLIISMAALLIGTGVGFYVAAWPIRFQVPRGTLALPLFGTVSLGGWSVNLDILAFAIAPIRPYLGDQRLKYLNPMDPFFITLK